MKRIYLDHSATTPVDDRVADLVREFLLGKFGNPSSIHSFGREANNALEEARLKVADLLNCDPAELIFTSGGTEADNIAVMGYSLKHRHKGDHVIIGAIEHPAVSGSADELEHNGFRITRIDPDRYG